MKERRDRQPLIVADITGGKMTNVEIAEKYGITPQAITFLKGEYDIPKGRTKKP